MTTKDIRPSTMEGITRLAKILKREQNLRHHDALDAAARLAGFQNLRHAQNALGAGPTHAKADAHHRLFITVYWKDRKDGSTGRETLQIWLGSPWADLIATRQFAAHRELRTFRAEGPDHLARRSMASSQFEARRAACAVARTLQFMDATKLRPSKGHSKAYPGGRSSNAVPGRDHSSVWYDPQSKRYLVADEPYEPAAEARADERAAWARYHGYVIAKPAWPGMYNPSGGSRLYLVVDAAKGVPLQPVVRALSRLPAPPVPEAWDGESAPFTHIFFSPGTRARAAEQGTQANPEPKRTGVLNSVGYGNAFTGSRRRPRGRMPIEAHTEVGAMIKAVLVAASHRKGVYNRLDAVRCELDNWAQREYRGDELPNEQFFELYYRESDARGLRAVSETEAKAHLKSMARVKAILAKHYPNCKPLRDVLKKVDAAAQSMERWPT